ncbi:MULTISPECIES: hypothetical protein [unclassified Microbacterium]|uniref:hypothetical protein n=1 Tax=unclassified Microbacterium TaxID=2609290 RepID=UPI003019767F
MLDENNRIEETESVAQRLHGRRAVVKSAAWSLPVIAAAVAAPVSTASVASFCQSVRPGWFTNRVLTTRPLDRPTATIPGSTTEYYYDPAVYPTIRVGMRLTFTYMGAVPLDTSTFAIGSFGKREPSMGIYYGDWKVVAGSLTVISPPGVSAIGFTPTDPLVPSFNLSGAFRLAGPIVSGTVVTIEWQSTKSIVDQPDLSDLAGDKPSAEGYVCTRGRTVLSPADGAQVSYLWIT